MGCLRKYKPLHPIPEIPNRYGCRISRLVFMQHAAGLFIIFLTEILDGISAIKGFNDLIVVVQQGWIKIQKIIVDALRHRLMLLVEMKRLTLKKLSAIFCQVALHSMDGHAIGYVTHTENLCHRFVGQCLLFVQ